MIDVPSWLVERGFEHLVELFEENEIDGEVLLDLTDGDLKELGLALGQRKKLLKAIARSGENAKAEGTGIATARLPGHSAVPSHRTYEAERRQLTVMFLDLVGSTELTGKLDPEDMRHVIFGFQNAVAGAVTRFDGQVAKYMGDGVLCYFGWPKAHEDDAERAVRAGLAIMQALTRLKTPGGDTLLARAGIATGLVVVGDLIGEGAAQEEAVVGETPNLAARMQSLAKPNQVVLSAATQSLVGGVFDVLDLGEHELKGISGKTSAYVALAECPLESRFEARSSVSMTEMVGRDHELALMLERWNQAKLGDGQLLLLSGEAGIGKSRIVRAMIDAVVGEPHTRLNYQCSPYHTESSFYPAIQQLTFAAGISDNDNNDERLDKLEATLVNGNTHLLATTLLGLDTERRYGALNMTPQRQRARTLQAMVAELIAQAQDKPVLYILEDAHWIDASMLELLDLCLDHIASEHVLMLITARPTFQHGFGGHPIVTKLTLNRLGREQVTSIIDKITDGKRLPRDLLDDIAAKTDGVPLFVEELTKTVLESGELRETETNYELTSPASRLAIPATLHDSLMARLDRLQPVKEVAQIAACIGRQFEYPLLESVSPRSGKALEKALEQLTAAELIFRRGVVPDATYVFKHALVRDAAYESLLKSRRQDIHADLVDVLEADGQVAPELIAHHASQADLKEKAIELWKKAGSAAMARPAYEEAISHFNFALDLIAQLEDRKAWRERELELLVQIAQVLMAKRGYGSEAPTKVFERAAQMIDATKNLELRVAIYYGMWIGPYMRADLRTCLALSTEFIDEVDLLDDAIPRLIAHRMRAATLIALGRPTEALGDLDISRGLYEENNDPDFASRFAQEPGVQIKVYQLLGLWMTGYADQALALAAEATNKSRKLAHANTMCYAGLHHGVLAMWCRDYALLKRINDEVLSIAEEHEMSLWCTYFGLGDAIVKIRTGSKAALEGFQEALDKYQSAGFRLWMSFYLVQQAEELLDQGHTCDANKILRRMSKLIEATGERWAETELFRIKGKILLAQSNFDGAESSFHRSIAVARQQGARILELRAATNLAQLWADRGEETKAYHLLQPIYEWFTEGFETADLMDARMVLGSICR